MSVTTIDLESWAEDSETTEELHEVTIKELTDICESMYRLKKEMSDLESEVKSKNETFRELEAKVLQTLEAHGLQNFECASGKVVKSSRVSVKQPATPEEKAKFFDFLRSKGVFEEMVSVNSNTLTAYVKKEIELAEAEGNFGFIPPGLAEPNRYSYLSLRKK